MSSWPSPSRARGVKESIRDLLDRMGEVRGRDVTADLGGAVSRQAVHQHLQAMVANGELERVGVGRAVRYRRALLTARTFDVAGLDEAEAWRHLLPDLPMLDGMPEAAASAATYVFTEMVNNVIDHSGSPTVIVRVRNPEGLLVFDVEDRGIGVFAKVGRALGLSALEAAQRLMLGKVTTAPERHTGEGIFFSSRIAHVFVVEANGVRWTVDNERDDWALGDVVPSAGTLVRFSIDPQRSVEPSVVFRRYTHPEHHAFDRTQAVVKMLDSGVRFVSRSEAKRLAAGLEPFEHVTLDFTGVKEVGQAFVDELFRVWAAAHPRKRLEPVHMSEPVRFMIERGRPRP